MHIYRKMSKRTYTKKVIGSYSWNFMSIYELSIMNVSSTRVARQIRNYQRGKMEGTVNVKYNRQVTERCKYIY